MARMNAKALLEALYHEDYEKLKGKRLRMTRMRIPGKEIVLAHILTPTDPVIYRNLALHIGVHEGEDHTGETLGILQMTPWETTIVAADTAVKAADVQVEFMDRFCGAVILTGGLSQVQTAVEEVVRYFHDDLGFPTCEIHRS